MTEHLRLGLFILQPHRQLLSDAGPVALGRKALQLLSLLAEARGSLVTKDEIMLALWPDMTVEDNTLHVHVMSARKALGSEARRLVTLRNIGYRLEIDGDEPEEATIRETVGVLPFANLTGDTAYDYLGESIAEELINRLSHCPWLKVSARPGFTRAAQLMDEWTAGKEVQVGMIVQGSIRKGDKAIRITAGLVEARTGFYLWSENFDHAAGDVLKLEDDVAGLIAEIVASKMRVP